jgi:hypothetical protein
MLLADILALNGIVFQAYNNGFDVNAFPAARELVPAPTPLAPIVIPIQPAADPIIPQPAPNQLPIRRGGRPRGDVTTRMPRGPRGRRGVVDPVVEVAPPVAYNDGNGVEKAVCVPSAERTAKDMRACHAGTFVCVLVMQMVMRIY